MNLDDLLQIMDKTTANLTKLFDLWDRAKPMIPRAPSAGTCAEYEYLRRAWISLKEGLPKIDGWTITAELPDIDVVGREFIEYFETGEPPFDLLNETNEPERQLEEYRFRLTNARNRAIRDRINHLSDNVDRAIQKILEMYELNDDCEALYENPVWATKINNEDMLMVSNAIEEIERLLGDSIARRGKWTDFYRHLKFSQGNDWWNIGNVDWPSIHRDINATSLSESDPIPVPNVDLGTLSSQHPYGGAIINVNFSKMTDSEFEQLLFDLIRGLDGYENVQWLTKTNAPDKGRDISCDRIIQDAGGATRRERTIIQAKRWNKSIAPPVVHDTLSKLPLHEPPVIRNLIIATSGTFTADAVTAIEKHNEDGLRPIIEMWPDSRLRTLVLRQPHLIEAYRLKTILT